MIPVQLALRTFLGICGTISLLCLADARAEDRGRIEFYVRDEQTWHYHVESI